VKGLELPQMQKPEHLIEITAGEDNAHDGAMPYPPFAQSLGVTEMPPGIEFQGTHDLHP